MTWSNPLSQPCRTGQHSHCHCHHDECACSCHTTVPAPELRVAECPLRCGWRTPQQVLQLELDPARERLQPATDRILEHLAAEHRRELLLMVAGMEGGHGRPVVASVVQHIDARQVQDAADLVVGVLVPQMRAQLARKLARENLRPVDPWPAVLVRKFCWANQYLESHPDAPGGMRPAGEDERPDLWQLELSTEAVPDTRTVEL